MSIVCTIVTSSDWSVVGAEACTSNDPSGRSC